MPLQPFKIAIDDDALSDLQRRLSQTRWPIDFCNDDWRYGTNIAALKSLVAYWQSEYSWRAQEREINRFPHFRVVLDDVPIHFIHQRGNGPKPIPLILSHGWPWTFWDFRKVIGPLSDPSAHGGNAEDAFDIVVPSLPGFGFSTPLTKPGVNFMVTADLWHSLMTNLLGYKRFGAHGADFGLVVTEHLGHKYAHDMIGIHVQGGSPLDYFSGGGPQHEDYGPDEQDRLQKNQAFPLSELGYMAQQATKPQTLAYALNDSPVGLCSWLLEKRRRWSDCGGDVEKRFSKDDLITSFMLYWLTESYGTSARYYYEGAHHPWQASHDRMPVVEAPSGVIVFKEDIIGLPHKWAEKYFNLQRWTSVPHGGHFGAMEEPEILVEDIRAFFRPLRNAR